MAENLFNVIAALMACISAVFWLKSAANNNPESNKKATQFAAIAAFAMAVPPILNLLLPA